MLDKNKIELLFYTNYYNGPLAGLLKYNGEKLYFNIKYETDEFYMIDEIINYFKNNPQTLIDDENNFKSFDCGNYTLEIIDTVCQQKYIGAQYDAQPDILQSELDAGYISDYQDDDTLDKILPHDLFIKLKTTIITDVKLIMEMEHYGNHFYCEVPRTYTLYRMPQSVLEEYENRYNDFCVNVGHHCSYGSLYQPIDQNSKAETQEMIKKYYEKNKTRCEIDGFVLDKFDVVGDVILF